MRFSAPSRVDAVAPWYRSGAKATNPAVASRSHRPLKKSFRPHHAWRTRRAGPLPVFGTARYPETFPSGRLVDAAFAGLQDSAPRSAVLALHARVKDVSASAWRDPRFVQVWGPRGAVYVVPSRDVAVFTLGRSPRNPVLATAVRAAA